MRTLIAVSMLIFSAVFASAEENESPFADQFFDWSQGTATAQSITGKDTQSAFATKTDFQRTLEEIDRARREWEEKVRGESSLLSGASDKNCPTWECAEKSRETDPNSLMMTNQFDHSIGGLIEGL